MYKNDNMKVSKFGTKNFLREVQEACVNGNVMLIEDVEEYIDPAIDPILLKQHYQVDGGFFEIKLGDKFTYDPLFRLYMTTKRPNPHYAPETCIKVTMINFTVTFKGLEEQLLGDVVVKERPEIEQ